MQIDVLSWNPRRLLSIDAPMLRDFRIPWFRVNNFGDLIGPRVVRHGMLRAGLSGQACRALGQYQCDGSNLSPSLRLLSVGSVLHFANSGDVVWGTGRNGKILSEQHLFQHLDVRMVRGPMTRAFLHALDIRCPAIYGDPGLLLPEAMPRLKEWSLTKRHEVTVIPNLNDCREYDEVDGYVSPISPFMSVLKRIAQSDFVIGSSLHAIVLAEGLGIPARVIRSRTEDAFKYSDYYQGTGRPHFSPAETVPEALRMGGEPPARFSSDAMWAAFPLDILA